MDPKELRGLYEAYSEVYAPQQIDELSNRKLRAYIKKSGKSHAEINKKWDQGTATDKEKSKSIGHEIGQHRAFRTLDKRARKEDFEFWVDSLIEEGYDLSDYTWDEMLDIYLDEAEGSYGATPKAYSAASKTKMTAKRKPFLKKMLRRTNPANRTDPYDSPRKGLTADDRERARAGSAHGVGTRQDHDYPSEGPGGVTKSAKKLRKQKAMGEIAKESVEKINEIRTASTTSGDRIPDFENNPKAKQVPGLRVNKPSKPVEEGIDVFDVIKGHLIDEGYADTEDAAIKIMANMSKEWRDSILSEEPVQDYRDMVRAKQNASGMRGPELSQGSKPTGGTAAQNPQPRSREFSRVVATPKGPKLPGSAAIKLQPRGREFANPPS